MSQHKDKKDLFMSASLC